MKEFLFALIAGYAMIPVLGVAAKLWYVLFMFGWSLL